MVTNNFGKAHHALMNGPIFWFLKKREGFFVFFFPLVPKLMCSHHVPKYIPQDVPNNTSVLSHMVYPKFNSHVYKLKRFTKGEYICSHFVTGGPKRPFHQGLLRCSKKLMMGQWIYGSFKKKKKEVIITPIN
jgi:hypothetical protein